MPDPFEGFIRAKKLWNAQGRDASGSADCFEESSSLHKIHGNRVIIIHTKPLRNPDNARKNDGGQRLKNVLARGVKLESCNSVTNIICQIAFWCYENNVCGT